MDKKNRRYVKELGGSLIVYGVLLFVSVYVERTFTLSPVARYVVLLSPMIGAAAMTWAILWHVRRLDELQRRSVLESLAFSFAVTAFGTFAWGFAETAGAPKLPTFAIWPIMAVGWIVGGFIAHSRYR